jgi:carboxylesterase
MKGAAPFFYPGNTIGCLLLHGITGTPFEMRWLGQHLNTQGYTVYGPRLAGHGTTPEDLARVTWREWYACALAGYEMLRSHCQKVFIIGLSMGGVLTLLVSSRVSVDGLVTLSAPFEIKDPRRLLLPVISLFIKTLPKGYDEQETEHFDRLIKAEQQRRGEEPTGHPSYQAWVVPGIVQFLKMLDEMQAGIGRITVPSLHIHSKADETVPFENLQLIYEAIGSADKQMLVLEKSGHCVAEDIEYPIVHHAVAEFISSRAGALT